MFMVLSSWPKSLREFTGSFDECILLSAQRPPTVRSSQSTRAVNPSKIGSYYPRSTCLTRAQKLTEACLIYHTEPKDKEIEYMRQKRICAEDTVWVSEVRLERVKERLYTVGKIWLTDAAVVAASALVADPDVDVLLVAHVGPVSLGLDRRRRPGHHDHRRRRTAHHRLLRHHRRLRHHVRRHPSWNQKANCPQSTIEVRLTTLMSLLTQTPASYGHDPHKRN